MTLIIQRAGDVIPQVLSVDKTKRSKKVKNLFFLINVFANYKTKKETSITTKKTDAVRRMCYVVKSVILLQENLKHLYFKRCV